MAASLEHSKELSGSESGDKFHDKVTKVYLLMKYMYS